MCAQLRTKENLYNNSRVGFSRAPESAIWRNSSVVELSGHPEVECDCWTPLKVRNSRNSICIISVLFPTVFPLQWCKNGWTPTFLSAFSVICNNVCLSSWISYQPRNTGTVDVKFSLWLCLKPMLTIEN